MIGQTCTCPVCDSGPVLQLSTLDSRESQVLLGGNDADGIGMTHPTTPSLHADNVVSLADDAELNSLLDTPL